MSGCDGTTHDDGSWCPQEFPLRTCADEDGPGRLLELGDHPEGCALPCCCVKPCVEIGFCECLGEETPMQPETPKESTPVDLSIDWFQKMLDGQ